MAITLATILAAQERCGDLHSVLVGTAALRMLGFDLVPEPPDLDFLVEPPGPAFIKGEELRAPDDERVSQGVRLEVLGVPVDYIPAEGGREQFLSLHPHLISGIRVARLEDVLGLKWSARRVKDLAFFGWWNFTYPGHRY